MHWFLVISSRYTYYYMAADPVLKNYLSWKKYITVLQLVQFMILFAQGVQHLFLKQCLPPMKRNVTIFSFVLDIYFIYGFTKFYIESYTKKYHNDRQKSKCN